MEIGQCHSAAALGYLNGLGTEHSNRKLAVQRYNRLWPRSPHGVEATQSSLEP